MGIPVVSGMPSMARKIIENSGLDWSKEFSSEESPSGGGGTVTALGLLQLKNAVLIWMGHDPAEIPYQVNDWVPDPNWKQIKQQLEGDLVERINRPGAKEFREKILNNYGSKCAISGIKTVEAIEIAHIVPYYGVDSDNEQNAIPLRSDLHKLYDRGLINIKFDQQNSVYEILIDSSIQKDYGEYDGTTLHTPINQIYAPSSVALIEHQNMFYRE